MHELDNSSALQKIPESEWAKIIKVLTIYAELRLDKVGFTPRSEIDGVTGEDFAMEAIKRLLERTRAWDVEQFPDVQIHLKLIVKSLISNHLKKSKKTTVKTANISTFNDIDNENDWTTEAIENINPEEIVITKEQWDMIEEGFGDDVDGFIFFSDWLDDAPPRKIAEDYSIEIKDVNNTIKKGKRIIKKIFTNY